MTLKIPEIPGRPVRPSGGAAAGADRRRPRCPGSRRSQGRGGEAEPKEESPPYVNPLLVEAREALERNDYGDAISGIDKFLASQPGNRTA